MKSAKRHLAIIDPVLELDRQRVSARDRARLEEIEMLAARHAEAVRQREQDDTIKK